MLSGISQNRGDLVLQTHRIFFDGSEGAADRVDLILLPLHHRLEDLLKLRERHSVQELVEIHRLCIFLDLRRDRRILVEHPVRPGLHVLKFLRHQPVFLIFQETHHKFRSRIFLLALLIHFFRQQHPRLDVEKRRRHHKEFADHIQIFLIHLPNVLHILVRDLGDRDIVDIHFVFFNQMEKKIQRTCFMHDVNIELWKLGVTSKTQHNEAAPAQHEVAPIYESANVAVDHNQLVMETLKRVAGKHGLRCMLHEKPFAGVNGSGKHNNWSITTDNGVNLLEPGQTPNENIQFLLVLACIMKAVDTHADLLRQSASNVGNEHRLGGYEAPPAIISIFLGEQLEDVVAQLVETGKADNLKEGGVLRTGVSTLPDFVKDATDRNRTSPFAFTGNKFEFRMVGSEDSIGSPNTTLNAIVAEAFCEAADRLEGAEDFDMAVHDLIKEYMTEHQRIIFNGNGYAREWEEEAARRGLPNIPSMVAAVDTLTTPKAIHLFEKFGIFTEAELRSRAEVLYETYAKTINIEALTMVDMANKQIIPAVMKYSKSLADAVIAITEAGGDTYVPTRMLQQITQKLTEMEKASEALLEVEKKASAMERGKEQAFCYHDEVMVAMNALRKPADELEKLVDKKYWPFPTYADLLFEV